MPIWIGVMSIDSLAMRYTYDNSSDNPRNPDQPPRRVFWGQRSADEMGRIFDAVSTKAQSKSQPSILTEITDKDIDNLFND